MVRNMTSSRDDVIPAVQWESSAPGGRGATEEIRALLISAAAMEEERKGHRLEDL